MSDQLYDALDQARMTREVDRWWLPLWSSTPGGLMPLWLARLRQGVHRRTMLKYIESGALPVIEVMDGRLEKAARGLKMVRWIDLNQLPSRLDAGRPDLFGGERFDYRSRLIPPGKTAPEKKVQFFFSGLRKWELPEADEDTRA